MARNLNTITFLYFSPCGHTKLLVRHLAEQLARSLELPLKEIDFTQPAARAQNYVFAEDELLVIGFPTYAGKLPNKIMPDLKARLNGKVTPLISLVTFGNRNFDNSLAELCALLEQADFSPLAAAAMVSQHVFSDKLARQRPNANDLSELDRFAEKVIEHISNGCNENPTSDKYSDRYEHSDSCEYSGSQKQSNSYEYSGGYKALQVSGDPHAPYYQPCGEDGNPVNFLKAKPKTDPKLCTRCGICAQVCSMGSIDQADTDLVPGICIKCQACVQRCPVGAKYFDDEAFLSHVRMLEANFTEPKSNAFFYA